MCNFFSWGIITETLRIARGLPSTILYLTDAEAETLVEQGKSWWDVTGHNAIAQYYKLNINDFEHEEAYNQVPRCAVSDINNGLMDKIQAASDEHFGVNGKPFCRYTKRGTLKASCCNYIEEKDGFSKTFFNLTLTCIDRYCKEHDFTLATAESAKRVYTETCKEIHIYRSILNTFTWRRTKEGYFFWALLYQQITGDTNVRPDALTAAETLAFNNAVQWTDLPEDFAAINRIS